MTFLKNAILFIPIFFLFSCEVDKAKHDYKAEQQKSKELIQQENILLFCQPVKNSKSEVPENEVFLQLAEGKMKVADVTDCQMITPSQYAEFDIPKNAISAVRGWWAGSGDYLYVVEEGGNYVVKKTEVDEMQPDSTYQYHEVVRYNKKGELMP